MKKLTAGIFATILGVTAMGAADAAIPSKGYVDTAVKGVADSVTTLGTDVARDYATKAELTSEANARSGADTTLQQNINTLAGSVYKKTETYSQAEVNALVEGVDGATAIQGINNEITLIKQEQETQNTNITNLQNDKVSTTTLNTTLADYAKTTALEPYAKTADVEATYATKTAINGMATQTWVEGKDYATNTALTTGLAGKVDNATLADYAKTADLAGVATTGAYADLTGTPDLSDMATKTEVANTYATKTAINGMATQTWVEGKDYATNTALTSGLAGKQANLTDAQLQAVNSGITAAKITTMDQATATAQAAAEAADGKAVAADGKAVAAQAAADAAQADATQALTNAGNAQTAADAANAALNSEARLSDGNYTLTMKVVGDTVSYGWELIDREYVSTDVTPNNQ